MVSGNENGDEEKEEEEKEDYRRSPDEDSKRYKDSHLSRKSTLTRSRRYITECLARTTL